MYKVYSEGIMCIKQIKALLNICKKIRRILRYISGNDVHLQNKGLRYI